MESFPNTLRHWRGLRRFSQLDLAEEAGISTRHLSFLETGRARPSRDMVLRLGETLELPLEARNAMLTAAGFAARYRSSDWTEADMTPVRAAIARTLSNHMPFPALALDRLWRIQQANPAALMLFAPFGIGEGGSLLELMMSEALPLAIENWPEVAHHAAQRLRVESAAEGGIAEFAAAIAHLEAVPRPVHLPRTPVIPTILRQGDVRLSLFATIAQFGTPEDLSLGSLKIELYFPMDEATEAIFASTLGQISS
ncbi:MAG: helix-turn-helix transcriptional regulator [Pseudomonadota bacterium]